MPDLAHPQWLWLLPAAVGLLALRFRGGVAEGRFKRAAGTVLRGAALAALIVAIAGPLASTYSRHTDVVFALDVSHSIDRDTASRALDLVNRAFAEKDPQARAGLVVFGADAAVETLLGTAGDPVREITSHVQRDGTDIGRAIEVAVGAFPGGEHRRIVLLSDGRENLGQARSAAAVARSIGVEIATVPLERTTSRDEVRVQGITAPPRVRVHEPFEVQMTLHSTAAGPARVLMLRNGALLRAVDLDLARGENALSFVEQAATAGLYEYEAIVNSDADGEQENNRYQAFVQVEGAPKVLHAVGEPGAGRPLAAALEAQGLVVDEVAGTAMPGSLHELAEYDLVILDNVPGFDLSLAKMELLETYVRDAGGGVIKLGGDRSYGAGGYYGTPVERLLPVTMDVKSEVKIPTLAVVILLDRSGSMATHSRGEEKLAIAKRAALASVELLNPLDRVGVLAFDAEREWTVPPTEAGDHVGIAERLRALGAGGGTDLYLALEEAHRVIARQPAKVKHLIVLSDGLTENEADFDALGERIAADGITVSTITFGADADRDLMAHIAALGRGRYYHTEDPRNIPRIFTSETMVVARDLVVERETHPALLYPGEILAGFAPGAFPPLAGYQRTFPKPAAQVLLGAGDDDPLLVSWRYGLGKSVAFTSDLGGRWGREWVRWPEFGRFVAQMARWTMRRAGTESLLPTFRWHGQRGEMLVDVLDRDERFVNGLDLHAVVRDPDRGQTGIALEQIAPGRYRGEFAVPRPGRYYVNVSGGAGEVRVGPKTFGLAVPYSSEYVDLGADRALLRDVAEATGGRMLPLSAASLPAMITPSPGAAGERWQVWWPYLLAALVLLVLEVAVRKLAAPESWRERWDRAAARRGAAARAEPEPGYAELQATIERVREEHLAALRDSIYYRPDDPASRARLYMSSAPRGNG